MARWNDRIEERTGLPILTIPFYDEHYEVVPTLEKYVCGGLAIELWELETGDPWSTLTVNLGVGNDRAQTIDTNNKLVKIVRGGGADVDDKMRPRRMLCINYSTGAIVGQEL